MIEIVVVVIAQYTLPVWPAASMVSGPAVQSRFDERGGYPGEDHSSDRFDGP